MERRIEIFVSGSTNPHISEEYFKAAKEFGQMLNKEKHSIVFDGCLGLPGVVASQIKIPNDNLSIAYTTNQNLPYEWPGASRNGNFKYQSQVTKALLDWSDVAVFFKGGTGTLTELFHAIDTRKNREHRKPIIIVNIENQWDDLLKILEPLELGHLYHIVENPKEVIQIIQENIKINEYGQVIYENEYDEYKNSKVKNDVER